MRILAINSVPFGSTGKIMMQILDCAERNLGAETVAYYGKWKKHQSNNQKLHSFGWNFENRLSFAFSYFTGFHNVGSVFGTLSLIRKIKKFKPDIIHIHNLHLWIINLPLFFRFLKKSRIKVVWTLHDCWSFTGQCPFFDIAKCDKWKTGCYSCPNFRLYPSAKTDNTKLMYRLKKKWFTGVKDLTIVTPSQWLADLVKESFLKEYPVKVIYNGIDLSVFKRVTSNFREQYNIPKEKNILLAVSFGWSFRKGIDTIIELSKRLDNNKYQIVLVGTTSEVEAKLPESIISIHRTADQHRLVEIYSSADLFINTTREETLGMVNLEALACGVPVITFNSGGSPECIDESCGAAVECDDIDSFEKKIIEISDKKEFTSDVCIARAQKFDMNNKFKEYLELYQMVGHE